MDRFRKYCAPPALVLAVLLASAAFGANDYAREGGTAADTSGSRTSSYVSSLGTEEELLVPVSIWGEVRNPGFYDVPDGTDATELISYAGGPTEYANLGRVRLTRPGAGVTGVDVKAYLATGDLEVVPGLMPKDTLYVPRNTKYAWRSFVEVVSQLAVIAGTIILYVQVTH